MINNYGYLLSQRVKIMESLKLLPFNVKIAKLIPKRILSQNSSRYSVTERYAFCFCEG